MLSLERRSTSAHSWLVWNEFTLLECQERLVKPLGRGAALWLIKNVRGQNRSRLHDLLAGLAVPSVEAAHAFAIWPNDEMLLSVVHNVMLMASVSAIIAHCLSVAGGRGFVTLEACGCSTTPMSWQWSHFIGIHPLAILLSVHTGQ